jgi:hypothetical protein
MLDLGDHTVVGSLFATVGGLLATTGPAAGIGGQPLPLVAIVGGVLIVALPYGLAVLWAARHGKLGTGRHDLRTERGPAASTASVAAALGWLAEAPDRRSVVLSGPGNRLASLVPSNGRVLLSGFDGIDPLEGRDVQSEVADDRMRRLLAADLDRLVGDGAMPVVSTFERTGG